MTKIQIFAPHPDDDLIGCGGILLKAKGNIQIVYVTKGILKDKFEEIAERRKKGIIGALKQLKVEQIFLGFYELSFLDRKVAKKAYDAINEAILKFKPDKIYVPAFEGGNFDHDITNYLVSKAATSDVYEYQMYNNYVGIRKLAEILIRKAMILLGLRGLLWDNERFIPVKNSKSYFLNMNKKALAKKNELIRKYEQISKTKADQGRTWPYKRDLFRTLPKHDYTKKPHKGFMELGYTRANNIQFTQFKDVVKWLK